MKAEQLQGIQGISAAEEPLRDPWNHPEEAARRLRRCAELRTLSLSLYRARRKATGQPDRYGIEYIKRRAEPSVHRPDPVEIWAEIECGEGRDADSGSALPPLQG